MKKNRTGMFIYDDEIRGLAGADADQVLADLDADSKTQKDKATWPTGARYRPAVEAYFALRAARDER